MFNATGNLALVFVEPRAIPDATVPEGLRLEEQINLTVRNVGDDQEYTFNYPITPNTIALQQLEQWQEEGKLVTVFASTLRAISFLHDTTKDKDGKPVKTYQRAGRKHTVGKGVTVESDAFVVFQAYDIKLAGAIDTAKEAERAHGDYLKRQAEIKKRSVAKRIEKAKERIKLQQEEAKAKKSA